MGLSKNLIFVLVALILAAYQVQSTNLILGNPQGSQLLYRTNATRNAVVNNVQTQDVVYRGFAVNITYIAALEVGVTQNATARLVGGGLNMANCTVRLTSAMSRGYNYTVEVWGR